MHVVNIDVVKVNKGYLLGSFFLQPPYILFIGNNLKYLISNEIPFKKFLKFYNCVKMLVNIYHLTTKNFKMKLKNKNQLK